MVGGPRVSDADCNREKPQLASYNQNIVELYGIVLYVAAR